MSVLYLLSGDKRPHVLKGGKNTQSLSSFDNTLPQNKVQLQSFLLLEYPSPIDFESDFDSEFPTFIIIFYIIYIDTSVVIVLDGVLGWKTPPPKKKNVFKKLITARNVKFCIE